MTFPEWYYDEIIQVGTDYENIEEVEKYDERMGFRDTKAETEAIIESIKTKTNNIILEIGCGTGEFAINASKFYNQVIAADVSRMMISYAEKKARAQNISNISFVHAGFLTYEHNGAPLDAVVSQMAFHHLPDFWKMIALKRLADMMKPGGMLYLKDVVFSINIDKYEKSIDYTVESMNKLAGDETGLNFVNHIKKEFSTYDWILEEMLYRAGFDIISADYKENFIATYVCKKS